MTSASTPPQTQIGPILKLLFYCAGTSHEDMALCSPHDRLFHSAIGSIVLTTAIAAYISGAYAVNVTFHSIQLSLALGLLWAVFIFNIDRLIIITITRSEKRFVTAIPRILLAILIGLLIARPLEIRLFEPEVNKQILLEKKAEITKTFKTEVKDINNGLTQANAIVALLKYDQSQLVVLKKELGKCQEESNSWEKVYKDEMDGKRRSKSRGRGNIAKALYVELEKWQKECSGKLKSVESERAKLATFEEGIRTKLDKNLSNAMAKKVSAEKRKEQSIENINSHSNEYIKDSSLLSKHRALSILADKSPDDVGIAVWIMTIIFVLFEIAPVFAKLTGGHGAHEARIKSNIITTKDQEKMSKISSARRLSTHKYLIDQEASLAKDFIDKKHAALREKIVDIVHDWKGKFDSNLNIAHSIEASLNLWISSFFKCFASENTDLSGRNEQRNNVYTTASYILLIIFCAIIIYMALKSFDVADATINGTIGIATIIFGLFLQKIWPRKQTRAT